MECMPMALVQVLDSAGSAFPIDAVLPEISENL